MTDPGTVGRIENKIRNGDVLEALVTTVVDGKKFTVYMNSETNDCFCPKDVKDPEIIKKAYIEEKRKQKK